MLAAIHDEAERLQIKLWDMALERYGLEKTQETKERINWTIATQLDEHAKPLGIPAPSTCRTPCEPVDTGLALAFLVTAVVYEENDHNVALHALVVAAETLGMLDVLGAMSADGGRLDPRVREKIVGSLLAERLTTLGKNGAKNRHKRGNELKAWAIEKYKAGQWKSASRAAWELRGAILEHGEKIGKRLTESNAHNTIAEWFRKSV